MERVMATVMDQDILMQELVDATIQLHAGNEATPEMRTGQMIRLRQLLRDLCLASGSWSRALESAYQADIAALRKLGGQDAVRTQEASGGFI
jgi:hypothetical protein